MLGKSSVYFHGKVGFSLFKKNSARLYIGDIDRLRPLKDLEIGATPALTAFIPEAEGALDDHFENWFLSYPEAPTHAPEGLESVVGLGQSQVWLPAPTASVAGACSPQTNSRQKAAGGH